MSVKLLGITILILCLCCSVTLARTPMGPPTETLEKGQWSIGFNADSLETDLKINDIRGTTFFTADTAHDFLIDSIMGKLAHGVNDNLEVYFGFGVSDVEYEEARLQTIGPPTEITGTVFESDSGFTAEIGTKVTFYDEGPLGIGASFQFSWFSLEGIYSEVKWIDNVFDSQGAGELETDIMVFQFAPGISYELFNAFTLYGGPLWQWIDGEGDADGLNGSLTGQQGKGDIRQDSVFGGWIGLHQSIGSDTSINLEWQATGSADTFAFSITNRF